MALTIDNILTNVASRTALLARVKGNSKLASQVDDQALLLQFVYKGAYNIATSGGLSSSVLPLDYSPTSEQIAAVMALVTPELENCLTFWVTSQWFLTIGESELGAEYLTQYEQNLDQYLFVQRVTIDLGNPAANNIVNIKVVDRTQELARAQRKSKFVIQPKSVSLIKECFFKGAYKLLISRGFVGPTSVLSDAPSQEQVDEMMTEIKPEHEDCIAYYVLAEWFLTIGEAVLNEKYSRLHDEELRKYRFNPRYAESPTLVYRSL